MMADEKPKSVPDFRKLAERMAGSPKPSKHPRDRVRDDNGHVIDRGGNRSGDLVSAYKRAHGWEEDEW
jgi:hypothetical protein